MRARGKKARQTPPPQNQPNSHLHRLLHSTPSLFLHSRTHNVIDTPVNRPRTPLLIPSPQPRPPPIAFTSGTISFPNTSRTLLSTDISTHNNHRQSLTPFHSPHRPHSLSTPPSPHSRPRRTTAHSYVLPILSTLAALASLLYGTPRALHSRQEAQPRRG